ncbi:hypothetical protein M9458_053310 [Cirrhinus mrigala]|uniref:B30.2/SPRY domain-containing protein n=1 Tax=Cirrhinus mrigala TaxID=683832 RepID=A0ABD0MS41_CIRMR
MDEHFIKAGIRKCTNGCVFCLTDACNLTLDPNTAHVQLCLSNGNRTAAYVMQKQPYPDHPERFESVQQVLSREILSGRCYWEAEWTGQGGTVGVAYKNIQRKTDDLCIVEASSQLGKNNVSWKVTCASFPFFHVSHADEDIKIKVSSSCSFKRVGVYVDTSAGVLSFYSVSDTLTHLHTYLTSFKDPLYAAFKVDSDSVSFCQM